MGRSMGRALPLLLVLLAGCSTHIPDDAVVVTDPALPGVRLAVWVEEIPGHMRLAATWENVDGEVLRIRADCGHPWQPEVLHNGSGVAFQDREACPEFYYDELRAGQAAEYRHSWDLRSHDLENRSAEAVAEGRYVFRMTVTTAEEPDREMTAEVPFTVRHR